MMLLKEYSQLAKVTGDRLIDYDESMGIDVSMYLYVYIFLYMYACVGMNIYICMRVCF